MARTSIAWFLASGALAGSVAAAAADLYVIAHPQLGLTPGEIREVFLGEKQFAGSTRLHPVENAPAQELFLARVVGMDGVRYAATWTKKSFRDGINPPRVKSGDAEVVEFVRRTPGAVSYVTASPSGVVVLQKY